MEDQIYVGSATVDAPADRGWLLGHFKPARRRAAQRRRRDQVGHPSPGDRRAQWVTGEKRTTVLILISGRFRVELPERDVLLARQGDYVVFHGIGHSWHAEEESVVMAVRWPSVPGYAVPG